MSPPVKSLLEVMLWAQEKSQRGCSVQAVSSSLEEGNLCPAERALEMFQEMAEIPSIPLSPIIPQLVTWCLHLASNTQLPLSLREQALTVCSGLMMEPA